MKFLSILVLIISSIFQINSTPIDEENFLSSPNIAPNEEDKNIAINLYPPEDHVQVLTTDSFKDKVENSTTAWFIQFYSSYSNDCENFAPIWKAFASEVSSWRHLVDVAVIACSDEVNTPICEDFGISEFPTILYIHESYEVSLDDLGVNETAEGLRRRLLDTILEEASDGRGVIHPNLAPYNFSDSSKVYDLVPDTALYAFLLVVPPPPQCYLGPEAILDFHDVSKISVLYANSENSELLANLSLDKNKLPQVLVFGCCDNKPRKLEGAIGGRKQLRQAIKSFLEEKGVKIDDETIDAQKNSTLMSVKKS